MTHSLSGYDAVHQPNGVAVWKRSPRGVLELRGADRHTFLQGMVSNDVLALAPGDVCHAALLDSTGHLLADLHVHAFSDSLVVETDPVCLPTLHKTLDKFLIMEDVTLADVSEQWAIFSVLGGGAAQLTDLPGERRPLAGPVASGFDLWLPAAESDAAWETLSAVGAVRMDEDAAEALRVEAGIAAWGHELSPSVLLPEASMDDAVSYTKGCYVGQEIVARLHARGHTNRALRQILLAEDAPVPPPGTTLHVPEDGLEPGREIGRITSAVASPRHGGQSLALAYIRKEYFADGTPVSVQIEQPGGLMFAYGATVLSR
jgi:folate-binding protein YgfZ